MQFINIVVHSVENMNFRVHLQYEFTCHGLDEYLEVVLFPPRTFKCRRVSLHVALMCLCVCRR